MMTFTEPHTAAPVAQDDAPATSTATKPRARQRSRTVAAPPAIRTRLVPDCAWPTEADALPARRGAKRR